MRRRNESPIKRVHPETGKVTWRARYTDDNGTLKYAKPRATFEKKGPCREQRPDGMCCAQHAIWFMYDRPTVIEGTIREYAFGSQWRRSWLDRHPRSTSTAHSYTQKLRVVLDVPIQNKPLGDYTWGELRRRHVSDLIDYMFRKEGRSRNGVLAVLRVLSTMAGDAINDEEAEDNRFLGHRVRKNDPRITKQPRKITALSFAETQGFAWAASQIPTEGRTKVARQTEEWRKVYAEAMLRVFSDCGLRLGEVLPLRRGDIVRGACARDNCGETGTHLHVERNVWRGTVTAGTKTDHGETGAGRAVPVSDELDTMLRALPPRLDTPLLFPKPDGSMWPEEDFRNMIWTPTVNATGLWVTPHDFRHTWISELLAAGVDPSDVADMAGHSVATMFGRYTHSLGRSFEAARKAVGS